MFSVSLFSYDSNVLVIFSLTSLFNDVSWTQSNNIASNKHMKADENRDILTVNFVKLLVTSYVKAFFFVSFSLGSIWNLTKNSTKLVNHFKVL